MQLKLQRSQRTAGLTASSILFCLDVRADYTHEERTNINRYMLGGQVIYNSRAAQRHLETAGAHLNQTREGTTGHRVVGLARGAFSMALAKMQLSISIASLGRGHHIECKDLEELLESEDTIRNACKNLTRYLEVANTFDGSEVVVEYINGEEKVHVAQHAPPLLEYAAPTAPTAETSAAPAPNAYFEMSQGFRQLTDVMRERWLRTESVLIATAKSLGWTITAVQVRVASGCLALVIYILLLLVL